jgi:hypothetical protein
MFIVHVPVAGVAVGAGVVGMGVGDGVAHGVIVGVARSAGEGVAAGVGSGGVGVAKAVDPQPKTMAGTSARSSNDFRGSDRMGRAECSIKTVRTPFRGPSALRHPTSIGREQPAGRNPRGPGKTGIA